MGGIGILFFILLYLSITVVVLIKVKPWQGKVMMLLLAILLPTADAVHGRYKLKQMCAAEGGVKIYRVAEHVQGILQAGNRSLLREGYRFLEQKGLGGRYYRLHIVNNEIVKEDNIDPRSKFEMKFTKSKIRQRYWRKTYSIETYPDNNEVLAIATNIYFRGGWAESFLRSFSGAGAGIVASCSKERFETKQFILSVLKP